MARISLEPRRTLLLRILEWYSRRHYGDVLDPGKALAHNPRVLYADARFEQAVAKFNKLDPVLKELAVTNLCLNRLASATAQRESYVGPWLLALARHRDPPGSRQWRARAAGDHGRRRRRRDCARPERGQPDRRDPAHPQSGQAPPHYEAMTTRPLTARSCRWSKLAAPTGQ